MFLILAAVFWTVAVKSSSGSKIFINIYYNTNAFLITQIAHVAVTLVNVMYSEITKLKSVSTNILIVDVFGILKNLYQYSTITYIGGGFNKGVHNTIEPAIYGNLILFGPKYKKFSETFAFIQKGIACSVQNRAEFEENIIVLQ